MEKNFSKIPLTEAGNLVVPGIFDAYRSNLVAPDHLLSGLSKNIIDAVYKTLPSNETRLHAEIYISTALKDNGLLVQNEVFHKNKKKMHTMSLSAAFCVLLVADPVFKILSSHLPADHECRRLVKILSQLRALVGFTFWWPISDLDGCAAEKLVQEDQEKYHANLRDMSKRYVISVDRICGQSAIAKRALDKPNLHRLIELHEHSIPALGHAREFMELVFECAHQPLKRCIARSNHNEAHISAVEHCVANDWQGRLAELPAKLASENQDEVSNAQRQMWYLLLGKKSQPLLHKNYVSEDTKRFIDETNDILQAISRQRCYTISYGSKNIDFCGEETFSLDR